MRRDRSPSEDRGRHPHPAWDNSNSQLPGTGIQTGFESGLYGTSRRRDHSVPERSRLRTSQSEGVSTGSTADGSAALPSPGVDRPSLFNSFPGSFSPFSAVNRIGASGRVSSGASSGDTAQILTEMANAEVRRQLEERVRASMVGTNVGAEVFYIGSPSDQTGSDFQSVRSRSTHSLSHPTTSPDSFGPIGSPSVSVSAIPEGAVSSPVLMSDVAGPGSSGTSFCAGVQPSSSGGSISSPPGLPLSDPPRVAGAYGVPAYDPDFGLGSRGNAVDPQVSIPPPPPQPAANAGVKDPYVQLLESQSAMSMLMMQMAREMNQRSAQQLQQPQQQQGVQNPPQQQAAGQQQIGQAGPPAREMRMDEKWIPAMPVPPWKQWSTRGRELSGFKDWVEKFCGWLCLIQDAYGPELAEAINATSRIQPTRSPEQTMRSKRLFHLLQQNFVGYSKIENLIRSQISSTGITESNGFELLRLIRMEFSLMSRTEALSYREQCLKFRVRRGVDHLLDIVREVESEIESFHAMLDASVIVGQVGDVRISEGDQFLLYMRNLPNKVQGISSIASECHYGESDQAWSSRLLYQNQSPRRSWNCACCATCAKGS